MNYPLELRLAYPEWFEKVDRAKGPIKLCDLGRPQGPRWWMPKVTVSPEPISIQRMLKSEEIGYE